MESGRILPLSPICSLFQRVGENMIGYAKWSTLELSLPTKIVNEKQYCVTAEINDTIKDLKETGEVLPTVYLLNSAKQLASKILATAYNLT